MIPRIARMALRGTGCCLVLSLNAHDARAGTVGTPQAFPQALTPAFLNANSEYGKSVAVSGITTIVGAPGYNGARGAVVIHKFTNGAFDSGKTIAPPQLAAGDRFGESVALSGSLLYIGAPGDDSAAPDAGAIYVYEEKFVNNAWQFVFVNELHAIQASAFGAMGSSLSADGYTVAAGAPKAGITHVEQGRVYVMAAINQNWSSYGIQNLAAATPQIFEHFGSAVAIDGDSLIIGAPDYDTSSPSVSNAGRAFMYERAAGSGAWNLDTNLIASDKVTDGRFGAAVDVDGSIAVVGFPRKPTQFGELNGGAKAYVKTFGNWFASQTIESLYSAYGYDNKVGLGVAIDGDRIFLSSNRNLYQFDYDVATASWGAEKHVIQAPFSDFDPLDFQETGSAFAVSSLFLISGRPVKVWNDTGRAFTYWRSGGMIQTLGGGTPGTFGTPTLGFAGPMVGGFACELRLRRGKPGALAMLAIHAGLPTAIPFHTGLLYAFPIHLMLPIPIDGNGEFRIPATMPAGVQNTEFLLQALISDPAGKGGVTLSDSVDMLTAP